MNHILSNIFQKSQNMSYSAILGPQDQFGGGKSNGEVKNGLGQRFMTATRA